MSETKEVDWTNPESVAAHLGMSEDSQEANEPEAAEAAPEPEAQKAEEQQAQAPAEDEPKPRGVQTKNKGRVLPWSVVEDARNDAKAAKQRASELEQELEKLRSQATQQASETGDDVDELLAKLTSDDDSVPEYDDLVAAVKAATREAKQARDRLTAMEEQSSRAAREQQELTQRDADEQLFAEHNDALKAAPRLAKWWNSGGPLADQAKAISERLLSDDAYNPKDRAAHYADVQREMEDLLGIAPQKTQKRDLPDPDLPDPRSLSDIPGGQAPEGTESEAFMQMEPRKAVALLAKMDPRKQSEFIARIFGG